jgi:hypothetical protein
MVEIVPVMRTALADNDLYRTVMSNEENRGP